MQQTTSVIICTRNRIDDLITCLESINKQTALPTELLIVDSSDEPLNNNSAFKKVRDSFDIEVRYLHTKPGLTYQRNRGIEQARGNLIYFFDDDVVLEPDYLYQMNKAFKEHPDYVAGMGDITNLPPISWKYQLFRTIFMLPRQRSSGNFTWSGLPTHPYGTKKFRQVEVLGGCCMALRASILKIFKFDEYFSGYCYLEDAEIGYRISREHKIFFNPMARLSHNISPTSRLNVQKRRAMFINNYKYMVKKQKLVKSLARYLLHWWSLAGIYLEEKIT